MTKTNAEILIREIHKLQAKHTPWELSFIESIKGQLANGLLFLSPKQEKILQEIYRKASEQKGI